MKINIEANIPDRWVNTFCSFLKDMENNGNLGHTARMLFISDGDGDFRPKFTIDTDYEYIAPYIAPYNEEETVEWSCTPIYSDIYDAG